MADAASEAFLSEIVGAQPWPGQRHANMESIYEYGSRAGFWRLHRLFTSRAVPVTVYGVATALARTPEIVAAMKEADWEIASHGLKWIDYKDYTKEAEREHMREAIRIHEEVTGSRPLGWYNRPCLDLLQRTGHGGGRLPLFVGFLCRRSALLGRGGRTGRISSFRIRSTPTICDLRQIKASTRGISSTTYLKDAFDVLYEEGRNGSPKMLNIGLHCRLVGRPARVAALQRFVDYVLSHDKVWVPRRIDIAWHWIAQHRPGA